MHLFTVIYSRRDYSLMAFIPTATLLPLKVIHLDFNYFTTTYAILSHLTLNHLILITTTMSVVCIPPDFSITGAVKISFIDFESIIPITAVRQILIIPIKFMALY
jgi:hypothetical protein